MCLYAWCQQLTAPTLVRGVTTQNRRAFALGACQWCVELRHIYNVLLRVVSSADSTSQWCFKFRTGKWCVDYGTATARLRAWPLRPTAHDINAWSYDTASARLRAWCLTLVRGVTAHLQCPITLGVYDVPYLIVVRGISTQHWCVWCAFTLGVIG